MRLCSWVDAAREASVSPFSHRGQAVTIKEWDVVREMKGKR